MIRFRGRSFDLRQGESVLECLERLTHALSVAMQRGIGQRRKQLCSLPLERIDMFGKRGQFLKQHGVLRPLNFDDRIQTADRFALQSGDRGERSDHARRQIAPDIQAFLNKLRRLRKFSARRS